MTNYELPRWSVETSSRESNDERVGGRRFTIFEFIFNSLVKHSSDQRSLSASYFGSISVYSYHRPLPTD